MWRAGCRWALIAHGESQRTNVESTRQLLADAAAAGVERFVYTSTLYSLAAGTASQPADEFTEWNLHAIDSDYTRTKRQAERLVLEANRPRFSTIALCPGMVQGPRDTKPTSTAIAKAYARAIVAIVPPGGIPIIDVELLALAHRRALICGNGGERYAVVGPYLSYGDLATLVASLTGRRAGGSRCPIAWNHLLSPPPVGPVPSLAGGGPTSHASLPPEGSFGCMFAATGPMPALASCIRLR